jgi:nucleoside-diphosphate-sugar epimerase
MLEANEICVIGGSGFIGSRLVRRLLESHPSRVRIVDIVRSMWFPQLAMYGDVRSVSQLRDAIRDGSMLVNLAAEHRDDVRPQSLYHEVNVSGARNICLVAREKNVSTIIFTSSVAIYGFAPIGTNEEGEVAPFNDYGRTKYEAEEIFRAWQAEHPDERTLVIIRPTVVFGERNRGNVYNLLRAIASGRFVMVGSGDNRKSMAYVENVAAFIEHCLGFRAGVHIFNYVDKPDLTMNALVAGVKEMLGRPAKVGFRIPFLVGFSIGKLFDFIGLLSGKQFTVSTVRIRKFCANSVYGTRVDGTGFVPPLPLGQALSQTVRYEFLETHEGEQVFFSE